MKKRDAPKDASMKGTNVERILHHNTRRVCAKLGVGGDPEMKNGFYQKSKHSHTIAYDFRKVFPGMRALRLSLFELGVNRISHRLEK